MTVIHCFHLIFIYQFGDSQKLRLVRILRSTVMVRVGGGWVALEEFLLKNDPCRGQYLIFESNFINIYYYINICFNYNCIDKIISV